MTYLVVKKKKKKGFIPLSGCNAIVFFYAYGHKYVSQTFDPAVTTWLLFQGDWVWLKKFEEGHFREVRQSTTKIFTKVQQHVLICKEEHWRGIEFLP